MFLPSVSALQSSCCGYICNITNSEHVFFHFEILLWLLISDWIKFKLSTRVYEVLFIFFILLSPACLSSFMPAYSCMGSPHSSHTKAITVAKQVIHCVSLLLAFFSSELSLAPIFSWPYLPGPSSKTQFKTFLDWDIFDEHIFCRVRTMGCTQLSILFLSLKLNMSNFLVCQGAVHNYHLIPNVKFSGFSAPSVYCIQPSSCHLLLCFVMLFFFLNVFPPPLAIELLGGKDLCWVYFYVASTESAAEQEFTIWKWMSK